MTWLRSLCIAFSMYSRLPVPCGNWDKEEMKYSIGLFPLVGIVIGGLSFAWMCRSEGDFPPTARALITGAVPLVVTGGIHADGFMDTSDALHSWADRAKKLQILSDPHIGAFSVLSVMVLAAFWISAAAVITESANPRYYGVFALEFVLARALSGLSAVLFRNARGEGTLWAFTEASGGVRRINLALLSAQALAAAAAMAILSPAGGAASVLMSLAVWAHYRWKAYREFGGITGDLEGWFLCRCEAAAACALALVCAAGL